MSDVLRSVYVYYRVAPGQEAAARAGVHGLFRALQAACPGLRARLMCKLPEAGQATPGDATWMEVYEHPLGVPADILAHLDEQARALLGHQTGPRHVEVFAPLPGFDPGGLEEAMRY